MYRLLAAGPRGASIIAKRSAAAAVQLEHRVYSELLKDGPVATIACFGVYPDRDPDLWWIFLEDAGDVRFDTNNPEHRVLAARWLGNAHLWATMERAQVELPDHGVGYQLELVRRAVHTIGEGFGHTWLSCDQRHVLEGLQAHLATIETQWTSLAATLGWLPVTLLHGDLAANNARVRTGPLGPEFVPLDFGAGGRGIPAADLSQVDLATYCSIVSSTWPGLDLDILQRCSVIGRALWCAAAIPGERTSLAEPWSGYLEGKLSYYLSALSSAVGELASA